MLRLIDPKKPIRWVHPAEKNEDGAPIAGAAVFHIIPLTEGQSRKLRAANPTLMSQRGVELDNNAMMREMFLQNVVKIEGVRWPGGGGAVTIETPEDKGRYLDCLPVEYASDIFAAIQNTGDLDKGAVGNSEESHASPTS